MPKTPLHGSRKLSKLDKVVISFIGYHEFCCGDGVDADLIKRAYQRGVRNGRKQENSKWLGVRMQAGPINP